MLIRIIDIFYGTLKQLQLQMEVINIDQIIADNGITCGLLAAITETLVINNTVAIQYVTINLHDVISINGEYLFTIKSRGTRYITIILSKDNNRQTITTKYSLECCIQNTQLIIAPDIAISRINLSTGITTSIRSSTGITTSIRSSTDVSLLQTPILTANIDYITGYNTYVKTYSHDSNVIFDINTEDRLLAIFPNLLIVNMYKIAPDLRSPVTLQIIGNMLIYIYAFDNKTYRINNHHRFANQANALIIIDSTDLIIKIISNHEFEDHLIKNANKAI